MGLTSNFNPELCKKILSEYRNGLSPSSICVKFGISERNYGSILKKYANEFSEAKEMRSMKQKAHRNFLKTNLQGTEVKKRKTKKISPEEKIDHLENRLELEKKKNQELEALLKVAKEQLGKL